VIDTHVHLDDDAFEDAERVWQAARAAGVTGAIAVGVHPSSWDKTIEVARLPGVGLALGIHPQVIPELTDEQIDDGLARLPALLSGAVAIGECGLDGPTGQLERQERVLRAHLALARDLKLPVSLHVLRVHGPTLKLLKSFGPIEHGVVHSYSGSAELVREYVKLGWSISFAGAITRSNARRPLDAVPAVPLEHLVAETDAPFQPTGADARDRQRGEPADLPDVIRALATARNVDYEEIAARTTENARRIFPRLP
jgi:TatD DNase family protein